MSAPRVLMSIKGGCIEITVVRGKLESLGWGIDSERVGSRLTWLLGGWWDMHEAPVSSTGAPPMPGNASSPTDDWSFGVWVAETFYHPVAIYVTVLVWPIAALLLAGGVLLRWRARRQLAAHYCPTCGYDLSAIPTILTCPECGAVRALPAAPRQDPAG